VLFEPINTSDISGFTIL